jgi:hypothetical protein
MNEKQFCKIIREAAGFEIVTYKTKERTSQMGTITGVFEKEIQCFIEGSIAAELTIDVSTFKTVLRARKKDGYMKTIHDWQLKRYIKSFSKDVVTFLKFRNKKSEEIEGYFTEKDLAQNDRFHMLSFIVSRCIVGWSGKDEERRDTFQRFVQYLIKAFDWEKYFQLKPVVHDEPEKEKGRDSECKDG